MKDKILNKHDEIVICNRCDGTGKLDVRHSAYYHDTIIDCTLCEGTGRLIKETIFKPFNILKINEYNS